MAEAEDLKSLQCGFESHHSYMSEYGRIHLTAEQFNRANLALYYLFSGYRKEEKEMEEEDAIPE